LIILADSLGDSLQENLFKQLMAAKEGEDGMRRAAALVGEDPLVAEHRKTLQGKLGRLKEVQSQLDAFY